MKNEFSDEEVQKIDDLNNKLILLEEKIFNLAEVEYLRVKKICENTAMEGYELHIAFIFATTKDEDKYGDYLEFANWKERVYFETFENDEEEPFGINDKYDWNVTRGIIDNEALNTQRHCWLLHQLYDNYMIGWENILRINYIYFDIVIEHEYEVNLEEMK